MRRQIQRNGLTPSRISFTDKGLRVIIADYTREAGVRQLEREIGTVVRKVARQVAEGTAKRKVTITEPRVLELLGKRKFLSESRRRTSRAGVATGLAWTPVGGVVLFIEATAMPGRGRLHDHRPARRGDAGVRPGGPLLCAQQRRRASFPTSPTTSSPPTTSTSTCRRAPLPKDGPSAGVAMVTALVSLLMGDPSAPMSP